MDKSTIYSRIWLNLIVAVLYSAAAYFGLYLAVPPGYATPIFASSGIALGFTLVWGLEVLPGIFIASFIVNFVLTYLEFPFIYSLTVGIGIGIGATLQAAFGYFIINRFINLNNQLSHVKEILLFTLISGPISCLINPTWSNTLLYLLGASPLTNIFHSWLTWWMGDSIGVLIFTPIILILFGKPASWRERFIPIVLPLLLSFTLVVVAQLFLHQVEINKFKNNFQYELRGTIIEISDSILQVSTVSKTLSHYLSTIDNFSEQSFNNFSEKIMADHPQIELLGWIPANEKPTPKSFYFLKNHPNLDTSILKSYTISLESTIFATRTEFFFHNNNLIFFSPVYRQNRFAGFAVSVVDFNILMQKILNKANAFDHLIISENEKPFYHYINPKKTPSTLIEQLNIQYYAVLVQKKLKFDAAPSYYYLNQHALWQTSSLLTGGLLFCVFINIILFIIYGQKSIIQKKVDEQTLSIKEEQEKFLSLLNSVGEGIFGIDINGNITFINQAARRMLDYSEIIQLNNFIKPLKSSNLSLSETGTMVLKRKDKKDFWTEYNYTPLIANDQTMGAVVVFNDITKRRESDLELERLAHYDALTDLPNRASFLEVLSKTISEARENHTLIGVCFVDIDNFKQVNDNYGHLVGDELLKQVGSIIQSKLSERDYIARLGGDEFGLIINHVESLPELEAFLQDIIKAVNQPIKIVNFEVEKSISIGAALYPYNTQSPEELLRFSDIAMYHAKDAGKNNYKIYNLRIHKLVQRKNQLDHYLHKAIENDEFFLLYQPQVQLHNNRLTGVEVLLYWNNDHLGGIISPAEFIPIAEDNGLIIEIGEWLVKKACQDFKLFLSECPFENFVLSVNVSVKQLENDSFLNYVIQTIKEMEINPASFSMEVTETSLMKNLEKTKNIMSDIKHSGILFALDDFGTGYSSMEYLRSLPISVLKIDKSFISDIFKDQKDEIIIIATIQLANALGIRTIAEGVETQEQYNFIKAHGCDEAQGFFISKPLRIEDLISYGKNKGQSANMSNLDQPSFN